MNLRAFCTSLASACVFLTFCGQAGTMRIGMLMDVKQHQSRMTFEPSKEHAGEDWLYLTRNSEDVEFEMRLHMSGQKEQVQKGRAKAGEVPGVTEGVSGYKRARVETFGNEPTLVIETKLVRTKKKDGKAVEEKEDNTLRIPLEFKSRPGRIDDLKGKNPVELRISKAGLKSLLGEAQTRTEAGMNANANGEGAKASVSGFARLLDSSRKGSVFVCAGRIQYEAPPMHIHVEGQVRVRGTGFD